VFFIAGGVLSAAAMAETGISSPPWPTAQQIDAARAARPMPSILSPTPAAPRGETPLANRAPQLPLIGALSTPPDSALPLDIAALAAQGAWIGKQAADAGQATQTPAVQVFVTLNLPRPSLQRLVDQAERSGATLVLRGLHAQSMRKTVFALGELIGQRRVNWVIDPKAFERYAVTRAPTFVVDLSGGRPKADLSIRPDEPADLQQSRSLREPSGNSRDDAACGPASNQCTATDTFVSVAGDVSLDHALRTLARHAPQASPVVAPMLARLDAADPRRLP
jgi:conjugal transfer pilus assembly protein TrbC